MTDSRFVDLGDRTWKAPPERGLSWRLTASGNLCTEILLRTEDVREPTRYLFVVSTRPNRRGMYTLSYMVVTGSGDDHWTRLPQQYASVEMAQEAVRYWKRSSDSPPNRDDAVTLDGNLVDMKNGKRRIVMG